MLAAYRRTGADLPFGDPARAHGTAFEGWFWRFTHAPSRTVVIALCGINRDRAGRAWGTVGLAATGAGSHSAVVDEAEAVPGELIARAGPADAPACVVEPGRVRVDLGPDAQLEAGVQDAVGFSRRAFGGIGPAHLVPGLSQYWHPTLLAGRTRGHARLNGRDIGLDGAEAYAEKNWGAGGFPDQWWWGQAHGFDPDARACIAFAGGRAGVGRLHVPATAVVARAGGHVVRVVKPLQRLQVSVDDHGWRLRAPGLEVEGHSNGTEPTLLPIPVPAERRHLPDAAAQHLAGHLRMRLSRRGRTVFEGETTLAGLERGDAG
jgi:hypothetical protein